MQETVTRHLIRIDNTAVSSAKEYKSLYARTSVNTARRRYVSSTNFANYVSVKRRQKNSFSITVS